MVEKRFNLIMIIIVVVYISHYLFVLQHSYYADLRNDAYIAEFNSKKEVLYDILDKSNDSVLKEGYTRFLSNISSLFMLYSGLIGAQVLSFCLFLSLLLIGLTEYKANSNTSAPINILFKIMKNLILIIYIISLVSTTFYLIHKKQMVCGFVNGAENMPFFYREVQEAFAIPNNYILKKEYQNFVYNMKLYLNEYSFLLKIQNINLCLFLILVSFFYNFKKRIILFKNKIQKDYMDFKKDRYT